MPKLVQQPTTKRTKNNEQNSIEEAVLHYQKCVADKNNVKLEEAYKKMCSLYDPMHFYSGWYDKYHYLFDSPDDFLADYLRVFTKVLLEWKPRDKRNQSRYNGTGEFKNYFIGSLHHNYINLIKAEQAGKRNVVKKCPICELWVNPLSTHLIEEHQELLWQQLEIYGINLQNLTECPLCTSFKLPKNVTIGNINELIRKHLISKHSTHLFQRFNDLHSSELISPPKPISIYCEEDGEELDLTDTMEKNNFMSILSMLTLSTIQQQIIERILDGYLNVEYDKKIYHCTSEEFHNALESLKDVMVLCGAKV